MWWAKTKQKAVDVWYTKAMMVDPRKTKITLVWNATSDIHETEEDPEAQPLNLEANNPKIIKTSNMCNAKDSEAANLDFEAAELNFKTNESNMDKTIDSDENTENLEPSKIDSEIVGPEAIEVPNRSFSDESVKNALTNLADLESNSQTEELDDAEILSINDFSEILENEQLTAPSRVSYGTEAHSPIQSKEDTGEMEQNLETVELVSTETLNAIASPENLPVADSVAEAVTKYETENGNFESMLVEKEPENVMFLRVLEKTRSEWCDDKKFSKIVKKMEKGKNLKRKEFDEVYMRIRNYCQYNN
ncbi:hypothetical protein E2P60_05320 [Candidatus Bathyarchaeota archaeon]|nr:hypothetical protein E2P60_05320 [Candidatus Bathyarchaeota archaeon]